LERHHKGGREAVCPRVDGRDPGLVLLDVEGAFCTRFYVCRA
jgi:hypothetical protein